MIVISDASPIITLVKINKLEILKKLYNEVLVPKAVYKEITSNTIYDNEIYAIKNCDFFKIVEANQENSNQIKLIGGIHNGESEAISYAYLNKCDLLLIDDEKARTVARNMKIEIKGTIGILIDAHAKHFLTEDEALKCEDNLKKSTIHISNDLYSYFEERIHLTEKERIISKENKFETIDDFCKQLNNSDIKNHNNKSDDISQEQ